jgi:hypothetical protein
MIQVMVACLVWLELSPDYEVMTRAAWSGTACVTTVTDRSSLSSVV